MATAEGRLSKLSPFRWGGLMIDEASDEDVMRWKKQKMVI